MDWSKPDNNSNYQTEVLTEIKTRDANNAKQDYTGDTNVPVGTIRFNRTTKKWEEWGGVSWAAPVTDYVIDVASVTGKVPGNANGNIALSNGALCVNLNADLLDGNQGSFYQNAANLNTGTLLLDRIPTTLTGKNADMLDGQHGSYYQSCANLTGTLPAARFNDTSHGNRAGGSTHSIATTTVNGFMAATDKVKLNTIETSAKDDQTASEILTLLRTVDGPGSLLDADSLDGLNSAAFMLAGGASQVGQAQLKTAEQTITRNYSGGTTIVMTGGGYCFATILKTISTEYWGGTYVPAGWYSGQTVDESKSIRTHTYHGNTGDPGAVTVNYRSEIFTASAYDSAVTATFGSRYVTASKPYDLGDGDIPLFIFAEIDNGTGDVLTVTIAEDPPWAYNGPTNTRPDYYLSGKGYQRRVICPVTRDQALSSPAMMERYLDSIRNPVFEEVEVCQRVKNADMNIIPHSFADEDLFGRTIVMLDPVSKMTEDLLALHLAGEDVGALIAGKKMIIDNAGLSRKSPDAVMPVAYRWKFSHNK